MFWDWKVYCAKMRWFFFWLYRNYCILQSSRKHFFHITWVMLSTTAWLPLAEMTRRRQEVSSGLMGRDVFYRLITWDFNRVLFLVEFFNCKIVFLLHQWKFSKVLHTFVIEMQLMFKWISSPWNSSFHGQDQFPVVDAPLPLASTDGLGAQWIVESLREPRGQQLHPHRGSLPRRGRRHRGLPGVRRRLLRLPVPPGGRGLWAGGGEGRGHLHVSWKEADSALFGLILWKP